MYSGIMSTFFLDQKLRKLLQSSQHQKKLRELFENLKDQRLSSMNKNWKS